jgi:microcystin-dependent protein
MSIQQFTALYSLLGVNFGGDGVNTFKVPNLQGYAVIGASLGAPGRENREFAQTYGEPQVTLTQVMMPSHTHGVTLGKGADAIATPGPTTYLAANFHATPGGPFAGQTVKGFAAAANVSLTPMLQPLGGSQPHDNHQPYLALNYCISLEGEYPQFP